MKKKSDLEALEPSLQLDTALDDAHGAEAVVRVLKEQPLERVTAVSLADKGLDAAALAPICDALSHAPKLEALSLAHNPLGDEGVRLLTGLLGRVPLRMVSLEGVGATAQGAAVLAKALRGSKLEGLSLDDNELEDEGATALAKGIDGMRLRFLSLCDVGMGARAYEALAPVLGKCPLEQLSLRHNLAED
ncbi:MAG TPA: hypothetical protein VFH51_08930, partial [Myxococcota bacterium]|nr:hypothetical protein [Myxococcota bacterium]